MAKWTVDVELDFGGRTQGSLGIKYGIPYILKAFKEHHIKGLFFISTELLHDFKSDIKQILEAGHEIGSHGHFHVVYKEPWRQHMDMEISKTLLLGLTGRNHFEYRAPKFCYSLPGNIYSKRSGHIGLLKHMWFGHDIPDNPIFYLHPFDIVDSDNPPNLFCRMWYGHPRRARETFVNLLKRYH